MRVLVLSVFLLASASTAWADDEPSPDELRQEIRQLKAEVEKLSAVVEGTAKPINLARTDFASVSSSGVNGGRPPSNKFYGVQNAFDGGEDRHDGINYSYWLSDGADSQFIDVHFDHPVTVTSAHVECGALTTPTFRFVKGEDTHKAFVRNCKPEAPLRGVTSVRFAFAHAASNLRVHEIQVMGYPHPDVKYKVTRPRLRINEPGANALAVEKFLEAGFTMKDVSRRTMEHMDRWEIIFHHDVDDVDLFQVVAFKRQAKVETKRLAKFVPIEDE